MSAATGAVVLMPQVSCVSHTQSTEPAAMSVPLRKPANWDALAFNRVRGNAGAIPDSYLASINGPDGDANHLGKHLPFVPSVDDVPEGFIAIMWGDPELGYAAHPNAVRSEANNNEGHWYNWIRIRKATDGEADESQSTYAEWPGLGEGSTGAYAVFGGGDITENSGKNTIYLAALPDDVGPGDTVRIYAHCLTHGEYVDFLTV